VKKRIRQWLRLDNNGSRDNHWGLFPKVKGRSSVVEDTKGVGKMDGSRLSLAYVSFQSHVVEGNFGLVKLKIGIATVPKTRAP